MSVTEAAALVAAADRVFEQLSLTHPGEPGTLTPEVENLTARAALADNAGGTPAAAGILPEQITQDAIFHTAATGGGDTHPDPTWLISTPDPVIPDPLVTPEPPPSAFMTAALSAPATDDQESVSTDATTAFHAHLAGMLVSQQAGEAEPAGPTVVDGPQPAVLLDQHLCEPSEPEQSLPPYVDVSGSESGTGTGEEVGDVFEIEGTKYVVREVGDKFIVVEYDDVQRADSSTGDPSNDEIDWDKYFERHATSAERQQLKQQAFRLLGELFELRRPARGGAQAYKQKKDLLESKLEEVLLRTDDMESRHDFRFNVRGLVERARGLKGERRQLDVKLQQLGLAHGALDWGSSLTPGVSDGRDVYEVVSGYDITGRKLTNGERALTVVGAAIPFVGSKAVRELAGFIAERAAKNADRVTDASREASRKADCFGESDQIYNEDKGFRIIEQVYCFAPDTPVQTPTGLRRIDEIQVGDLVRAFNFDSGLWVDRPVEAVHHNQYNGPVISITTDSDTVRCTVYHPFWVVDGRDLTERPWPRNLPEGESEGNSLAGRWVNSHDLRPGDTLTSHDGHTRTVLRIEQEHKQAFPICNLTVATNHSYAVSEDAVLAHNAGLCGEALDYAVTDLPKGGGHAMRHLIDVGLIPNSGSLQHRMELFGSSSLFVAGFSG